MNMLKTRHHNYLWLGLLAGLLVSGCVGNPITFPDVGGEKIDSTRGRPIRASACGFQLMLFIPININERAERAYASLRERAGQDVIADVKVQERWFYAFVGTGYCTVLQATAYPRVAGPM
jgi:hypothetical protein